MTHLAPLKSEVWVGGGWEDWVVVVVSYVFSKYQFCSSEVMDTMCKTNQQMKDSVVNVVLNTCSLLPV